MEPAVIAHPGASKQELRQKVWDHMEDRNLADFPRPVHYRIPNFKGALTACARLAELHAFARTAEVKVDPDKPLEGARLAALQARKTLLVPTPRLRSGLFNKILPPQGANKEQLRICSTAQGVKNFSVPVGLEAKLKVDLVVVGSVAVSEKGFRVGKGEGYSDMEYGMMASTGAVSSSTVVVTVVHDCQVVDVPEELMEDHDLTVDFILTPTRVIQTECSQPKPEAIIWSKLDTDTLEKIPVLKKLRALQEQEGKDVTLGAGPRRKSGQRAGTGSARVRPERKAEGTEEGQRTGARDGGDGTEDVSLAGVHSACRVFLGGIPAGLRVSQLKVCLQEREATPHRLSWQGGRQRAFLDYGTPQAAQRALLALQGLCLSGHHLRAELAKNQRAGLRPLQAPPTEEAGDAQADETNLWRL
ncbi:methenyltetrahydrofolate synthase domain-containing protein [Genypterus blacodes]|uniref:methenyltetrahydrofolate synthase domain-containing protein n=1 Tax=Genypterus blacodes TaxID=154954 RepID=UPI003F76C9A0